MVDMMMKEMIGQRRRVRIEFEHACTHSIYSAISISIPNIAAFSLARTLPVTAATWCSMCLFCCGGIDLLLSLHRCQPPISHIVDPIFIP